MGSHSVWVDSVRTHRHWSSIAILFTAFAALGLLELGKAPRRKRFSRRGAVLCIMYVLIFFVGWVGLTHQDAFREWWYKAI